MNLNTRFHGLLLVALLCGQALAEPEVIFGGKVVTGRKLAQRRQRTGTRPSPQGGSPDDWEFVAQAVVKGLVPTVFREIRQPSDALRIAFRDLVYSVTSSGDETTLELNSANKLVIEHLDFGIVRPGLFHLFRIKSASPGILVADGTSIDIAGSQFFIQVVGISSATIEIGWLGNVSPGRFKDIVSTVFEGIIGDMADSFLNAYTGAECVFDGGLKQVMRDISAVCNNVENEYGSVNAPLKRTGAPDFADGSSAPGGSKISPRKISNIVCREDSSSDDGSNKMKATDAFVFMGQFLDHDIGISPVGSFSNQPNQPLFATSFEKFLEEIPIEIPEDDPDFTSKKELPFERATFVREDNSEVLPRTHVNQITSYLDLNNVYGSSASRSRALRSFNGGRMKTSSGNFLPFNGDRSGGIGISIENAPDASSRFFVGGDIRAQENVNLLAYHTIWLREHNRIADILNSKLSGGSFTEEVIFQLARAINIAQYQSIVYTEWLPILLGGDSPSPGAYSYNAGIDAGADAFFTTASFRFGHSMVSGTLWRVDSGSKTPSATAGLRSVFFEPEVFTPSNADSWIRGMAWHEAREPDELVHDDLRSFLFTDDGAPSQDLIALNIQRARDMGVPTYNKARGIFGLTRASSFSDITSDPTVAAKLEEAYEGDVDAVDSFVGGLAEDKPAGRMFGDLFHESLKEQFTRLRDGDRLFYKGNDFELEVIRAYPEIRDILADKVKFIDVLSKNTGVSKSDLMGRASPFQL